MAVFRTHQLRARSAPTSLIFHHGRRRDGPV